MYYFYIWGIYHTWMVIVGALIYSMYPGMIRGNGWANSSWWQKQCPITAWTKTEGDVNITRIGATSSQTSVTTMWNRAACIDAAPVT